MNEDKNGDENIFQRRINRTKTQVSKGGSIISKKIIRYLDEAEHSEALAKIRQISNNAKEKTYKDEDHKSNNFNNIDVQQNTEINRLMFKQKTNDFSESNFYKDKPYRNRFKNKLKKEEEKIEDINIKTKLINKNNDEYNKTEVNKNSDEEPIFQRKKNRTKTQVNRSGNIFSQKIIRYLDEPEHSNALEKIRQISNQAKEKSSNEDEGLNLKYLNDTDLRKNTERNRLMFKGKENDFSEKHFKQDNINNRKNLNNKKEGEKKINDEEENIKKNIKEKKLDKDEDEPIFQRRINRTKTQVNKGGSTISKKIIRYLDDPEHSDALSKIRKMSNKAKEFSLLNKDLKNFNLNDSDLKDNTEKNRLMFKHKQNEISDDRNKNNTNFNRSKNSKNEYINNIKNDTEDSKEKNIFDFEEDNNIQNEEDFEKIPIFKRKNNRTKTQVSKSGVKISEKIIRYLDDPQHPEALEKIRKLNKKKKKRQKNVHAHFNEPNKNKFENNIEKNILITKDNNGNDKKDEINNIIKESEQNGNKDENETNYKNDFSRIKKIFSTKNINVLDEIKLQINKKTINDGRGELNSGNLIISENKIIDKKDNIDYGKDINQKDGKDKNENEESIFQRRKNRTKTQVTKNGSIFGQKIIRYLDDPEHSNAIEKIRQISNKAKAEGSKNEGKINLKEKLPIKENSLKINEKSTLDYNNDKIIEKNSFLVQKKENDIFEDKNRDKNNNILNKSGGFRNKYRKNFRKESNIEDSNEKTKTSDNFFDKTNSKKTSERGEEKDNCEKVGKKEEYNDNKKELKEIEKEEDFEPSKFERRKNRTKTQVSKSGIKISEKIIRYIDDPQHSEALAKVKSLSKRGKSNKNINKLEDNNKKNSLISKGKNEEKIIFDKNNGEEKFIRRKFQFPTQTYIPKNINTSLFDEIKSNLNKNKIIENKSSDEFNLDNLIIKENLNDKKADFDNVNYNSVDYNKNNRFNINNLTNNGKLNNDEQKIKNLKKHELKKESIEKNNIGEEKPKNEEKEILNDNQNKGNFPKYRRRFLRYRNSKLTDKNDILDHNNYINKCNNTINYNNNNDYKKDILNDNNNKTIDNILEDKEKKIMMDIKVKTNYNTNKEEKEENKVYPIRKRFGNSLVIFKNEKTNKNKINEENEAEKSRTIENQNKELNRDSKYRRRFYRKTTNNNIKEEKPKEEIVIEKKEIIKIEEENTNKNKENVKDTIQKNKNIKDNNNILNTKVENIKMKIEENKENIEHKKEEKKIFGIEEGTNKGLKPKIDEKIEEEKNKKPNNIPFRRRRFYLRNNECKEKEEKKDEKNLAETIEKTNNKISGEVESVEKNIENQKKIYSKKIKVEEKRPIKETFKQLPITVKRNEKFKEENEDIKKKEDDKEEKNINNTSNNPYNKYQKKNIRINVTNNFNNPNNENKIKNHLYNSRNRRFYKPIKTDSELIDDLEKIEDYSKNTYLKNDLIEIYNNITEEYTDFKNNVFYTNINSFEVNMGELDKKKVSSYMRNVKVDDLCKGRVTTDDLIKKYSTRAKYKLLKKK